MCIKLIPLVRGLCINIYFVPFLLLFGWCKWYGPSFVVKVLGSQGSPQFLSRQEFLFKVVSWRLLEILIFMLRVHDRCSDKTVVSNWLWRGGAKELHFSNPCQRVSDYKSMQYLKGCVGYFPFCMLQRASSISCFCEKIFNFFFLLWIQKIFNFLCWDEAKTTVWCGMI